MIPETLKVVWPPRLALHPQFDDRAWEMRFVSETPVVDRTNLVPAAAPQKLVVFRHGFKCPQTDSYFLARLQVRPCNGKPVPRGRLSVRLDGEEVVGGEIPFFLQDVEAIDPTKLYPWGATTKQYLALALLPSGAADRTQKLGFMMPNKAHLEVHLTDLVVEEETEIEIEALAAYYTTKSGKVEAP